MKTIHWLQHVPFEGLGAIKLWADAHHIECIPVKLYENNVLPDPSEVDMVVIMGGPMGISDTALYPWLPGEISWVKTLIQQNKKILGICLGAQIIAHAMGAGGNTKCPQGDRVVPGGFNLGGEYLFVGFIFRCASGIPLAW